MASAPGCPEAMVLLLVIHCVHGSFVVVFLFIVHGFVVIDSLFIVAPIVCVGSVFDPCCVPQYLVYFLVLQSSL